MLPIGCWAVFPPAVCLSKCPRKPAMSDLLTQVTDASHNMLPLGRWVNAGVKHLLDNGATAFDSIGGVVEQFAQWVEMGMLALPFWLVILVATIVGVRRLGWRFGVFV